MSRLTGTGVPTVVAAALCTIALANGMWMPVAVVLLAWLLLWIRDCGPDDPQPPTLSDLRKRQLDDVVDSDRGRR